MLLIQMKFIQWSEIIISAIVIFLVYNCLRLVIRRQIYCKAIPALKVRLIDALGHLNVFPFGYGKNGWNGHSATTYLLQIVCGFFYLFKKEEMFCTYIGYFPCICLNTPEAVEEILNGTKAMKKGWFYSWLHCWLGTGLLTSHGTKWKSRRKQLTPAFHFEILKDFLPVINEKSQQLVKILEKETTKDFTNIVTPLTLCSLDIICETTLGVNINAQANISSDYVKAVATISDALTSRLYNVLSWFDFTYFLTHGRAMKKDLKLLHDFTNSVIQEKKKRLLNKNDEKTEERKHKRKALMDILLEHHLETKDLTEENIREEVDTFTFEGHDTTSMALSWTCYLTGLHKDIQDKAREELDDIFGDDRERPASKDDLNAMKYLECIIKESLRLFPSVPMFARQSDGDMNIRGYQIPNNSTLVVVPYMLHRNENIFPNPENFDPDRFSVENSMNRHPYAYVPFSAGPRNCIGQRFAMMELKTVLSHILRNYTLESLDPRDKVNSCIEIILRPTKNIRIKIRPRHATETKN